MCITPESARNEYRVRYQRPTAAGVLAVTLMMLLAVISSAGTPEVDRLLDVADSLYEARNIDSAIVIIETSLELAIAEYGPNDTAVASIMLLAYQYSYTAGKYGQAEQYIRNSLAVRRAQDLPDELVVAKALRSLGAVLFHQANYLAAESTYTESLQLMEASVGSDHEEYAKTLDNLGLVYVDQGRLDEALSLHQRSVAIKEAALGPESAETARSYSNLAAVYGKRGDYRQAEALHRRALKAKQAASGPNDISLLPTINNLANIVQSQARYTEAEDLFRRALTVCETNLGAKHRYVGVVLNNLAATLSLQARYAEAEVLHRRALATLESSLGANHPSTATVLLSISDLMRTTGRFAEAEEMATRSLEIRREALGPNHSDIAASLVGLATMVRQQGKYADAEPLFNQAIDMYIATVGDLHPRVADAIMGLANLKFDQGRLTDAESLYRQALDIYGETFESDHPAIGLALQNLANLLHEDHRYADAEELYRRALDISDAGNGREHPRSALVMFNLGETLLRLGRLAEADTMTVRALSIRRHLLKPNHRDVGYSLVSLSQLRERQGRLAEAESLLVDGHSVLSKALGSVHPEIARLERDMARLSFRSGRIDDAITHFTNSFNLKRRFLEYAYSFSSEGQKLRWLNKYPLIDNAALSLTVEHPRSGAIHLACEMILNGKATVVDASMIEHEIAICSDHPELQESAKLLAEVSSRLANLSLAVVGEEFYQDYRDTLDNLVRIQDSIETQMSRQCAEFDLSKRLRHVQMTDIADALPMGSVLWEYIRYRRYDFDAIAQEESSADADRYLGLVVKPSGESSLIDLGPAEPIDSLVRRARHMIGQAGARILSPAGQHLERQLKKELRTLYDLVFAPLAAACDNDTVVLVSPDGSLSLLPLQVLPTPDDSYVIERYSITYLSSGRDVLGAKNRLTSRSKTAVMLADPDFDRTDSLVEDPFKRPLSSNRYSSSSRPMSAVVSCLEGDFLPLGHSREEVRASSAILRQAGFDTRECYGIDASETTLKNIVEPPQVLHVATHGVFCDTGSYIEDGYLYRPLIANGLALAGANNTKSGGQDSHVWREDGFLTALEVSDLNLLGTQLAVLSACETGLGEIVNGEGVIGLRRALHHAGVESVVISLWRTPDEQTSELVCRFYEHWLGGMGRGEALRRAALEIIDSSRSARGSAHPLLWGGFILEGDSH